MADNDYIGQLQNSRWQSLNSGYLSRTPSWMRGDFKQGTPVSSARYQPARAGVSQYWAGGEIRDTRTRPGATAEAVNKIGQGFVSRNLNRQAQAQQAQQQAQAGQNMQNQYQAAFNKYQYQSAFQKAPAPTLPTAPLQPPAPNATPYNPALGLSMGQNPTSVSLKSGIGKINQNLANWQSPDDATDVTTGIGKINSNLANWEPPATSAPTSRTMSRGKGWK